MPLVVMVVVVDVVAVLMLPPAVNCAHSAQCLLATESPCAVL